jgi:3-deoxy-D-manno-octulosonic-acid transferase
MIRSVKNSFAVLSYKVLTMFLYVIARIIELVYPAAGFSERLGFYSAEERRKLSQTENVWIHAASAGEVNAISPFCKQLRKAKPDIRIIVTTTSQAGKKMTVEKHMADAVFLAPLDMKPCLERAFNAFRPVMLLVAETEFWPGMLGRAQKRKVPVILVNGRISDHSFPNYLRFKSLFGPTLSCFQHCLVQTAQDKEKLLALGVEGDRISVTGQLKYDLLPPDGLAVQKFKEVFSLLRRDILFTFGSVRTGEDDQLLPLMPKILALSPEVKILLAPRHLKNVEALQTKLKKYNVNSTLRSRMAAEGIPERIILLDTLGELALSYAFSRAAFVGGTLVPIGGHNLMEPALANVPVCFGPHTSNVTEAAETLVRSGGGFQVKDANELIEIFQKFLDEDFAKQSGRKAQEAVNSMRGATAKTVEAVLSRWPKSV